MKDRKKQETKGLFINSPLFQTSRAKEGELYSLTFKTGEARFGGKVEELGLVITEHYDNFYPDKPWNRCDRIDQSISILRELICKYGLPYVIGTDCESNSNNEHWWITWFFPTNKRRFLGIYKSKLSLYKSIVFDIEASGFDLFSGVGVKVSDLVIVSEKDLFLKIDQKKEGFLNGSFWHFIPEQDKDKDKYYY